jgi:hypothetical protein
MEHQFQIEKTGRRSDTTPSEELMVTFPNGDQTFIWSPPRELNQEDFDSQAQNYANKIWERKQRWDE